MKIKKSSIWLLLINAVIFYTLPIIANKTGAFMLILIIIIPASCFITGLIHGALNGFNWFYPVLVSVIFVPAVFIYFNSSDSIYIFVYGETALVGTGAGGLLKKK